MNAFTSETFCPHCGSLGLTRTSCARSLISDNICAWDWPLRASKSLRAEAWWFIYQNAFKMNALAVSKSRATALAVSQFHSLAASRRRTRKLTLLQSRGAARAVSQSRSPAAQRNVLAVSQSCSPAAPRSQSNLAVSLSSGAALAGSQSRSLAA